MPATVFSTIKHHHWVFPPVDWELFCRYPCASLRGPPIYFLQRMSHIIYIQLALMKRGIVSDWRVFSDGQHYPAFYMGIPPVLLDEQPGSSPFFNTSYNWCKKGVALITGAVYQGQNGLLSRRELTRLLQKLHPKWASGVASATWIGVIWDGSHQPSAFAGILTFPI